MNRITTVFLALMAALKVFTACEFNRSVHKDLKTGALSKGNGIDCKAVSMEINGTKDNRNTFVFGEKVNFVFDGLTGFTEMGEKNFPGLSLHIVKNERDTVLAYANLLDHLKDGIVTASLSLRLQASFTAALSHKDHEEYKVLVNIWDEKGDGTFSYEMPFTVKDAGLLNIESKGVAYSNIYLWNESLDQPVLDKTVSQDHTFRLIFEGVTGLEEERGNVFPVFSIDLVDHAGNIMLSDPNIFSDYESTGVGPSDLKKQASAKITFQKGKINNPCRLTAILKDKHSEKKVMVTTALEITNEEEKISE